MRENNHIFTRNNYQDMSSYKIRQPLDDKFYINRSNQYQDYSSQENNIKLTKNLNRQTALGGYYLNQVKNSISGYDERSQHNSRDLSYQSKGSNISKNSIKMSDYVALGAKNLLQNKDKFRFEGQQNHARSSSMQYYSKTSMKFNPKHHYTIQKSQQPCEIPSFGIQCRSTLSSYDKPSTFIQHNTSTSYYKDSAFQQQLRNQKLKSQIDERIQRLRTSSNSTQHKERLNTIKVLDANRIQNMDKINIKIKNILRTLQSQQDHYKRKFTDQNNPSNRIKTVQSSITKYDKYDDMKYSLSRVAPNQSITFSKQHHLSQVNNYQQRQQQRLSFNQITSKYNNDNKRFTNLYQQQQQQQFQNHTISDNNQDINVSSYYCYDDNQQAILKSSQSPIKSTSQKSMKKISVSKWEVDKDRQMFGSKKYQTKTTAQYKLNYSQFNQRSSQKRQPIQKQYQKNYKNDNLSILNNIPQCQTQLIQSKAIENLNNYHTFQSQSRQYDQKTHQNYKEMHIIKALSISQEITSQALQVVSNNNEFNSKFMNYEQQSKKQSNNNLTDTFNHHKKSNDVYLKLKGQQQQRKNTINYETKCFKIQNSSQIVPNTYSRQNINHTQQVNQNIKTRQNPFSLNNNNNTNQPNYYYYDSIKQTPRIAQQSDRYKRQQLLLQRKISHEKRSQSYSHQNDQLQNKLKSYQKRIQNYNRQMSASKLLDTKRSRSQNKTQKNLSDKSFLNHFDDRSISNNASVISQRNVDKMLTEIEKQRTLKQYQQKSPKQSISRQKRQFQTSNEKFTCKENQLYQSSLRKSAYQQESSKKHKSPRQSHRFAKQDHQKFIENLKKEREQVAALSKRKNRQQNSTSMDFSRLSPLQRSNQRSQSQNSRLSSVTIVKGKNVDAEIEKLQKKMQHYEQMKKQLHLESQQNTQRSLTKNKENRNSSIKKQSPMSLSRKYEFKQKSPQREKNVRFEDRSNIQSKRQNKRENNDSSISRINSTQRKNDLLKIVAEQNSYVKVRKSIIKEHKTTEIKNYLNQELEKQSTRPPSTRKQKTENSSQKRNTSQTKENISPSESRNIQTHNYNNKPTTQHKKVIFGLAQNLTNFQKEDQQNNMRECGQNQNDVNTPKLLRNLKNKQTEKSIVKKKAQKRGFRSQFINDLHQDNELIYSAKKNQKQFEDPVSSTSRIRPQCQQTLVLILSKFQEQITRDQRFRNEKKLFNALIGKDKWNDLMNEYVRLTKNNKMTLTQVMDIFTLNEQESNPFYSTRGNQFTLQSLIQCHLQCEQNWTSLTRKISSFSFELLQQCGFNSRNLDIEKKGYIDIEDLTRFLNMEMNKYYRKRDLYLLWKRIQTKSKFNNCLNQSKAIENLTIDEFLIGLGAEKNLV